MKFLLKILFVLIFCNTTLFSQTNLKFVHYSLAQGLSQSTVQSIIQDNKGFLWIGTRDGLNRFDGYKFYNYNFIENDTNSISDGFIRVIFQDKNGNLWIGTNKGLNKLNPDNNLKVKFIRFVNNKNDKNSISNNEVKAIYQTANGDLWMGTANGLNKISADQLNKNIVTFKRYFNSENNAESLKNNITSIAQDNSGNLWIGTLGGGLNKFNIETGTFTNYTFNKEKANSISSNFVMCLYRGKKNNLWIGTYGGGLVKLELEKEKFTVYKVQRNKNSLSDNRIFDIREDKDGNLWLASFGGGINKFNPASEQFEIFRNDKKNNETISSNFVRSIFIDRSNNLWAGTNGTLEKTNLNPQKFYHFINDPWDSNSLQDNHVLSILEDHLSSLWIGTNKGLDKFDFEKDSPKGIPPSSDKFFHYKINHNNPQSRGGFVYAIYEDKDFDLWFGTFGGGLYKYDRSRNHFKQFLHNPKNPRSIIDNRIVSIAEDESGNIIAGSNIGVCKFNKNTEEFIPYILSYKDSAILSGKRLNVIYKDSKNNYWIGTPEGLIKIKNDSSCVLYSHNKNDASSISKGNINSICEDEKGSLWIGTDNGLNLLKSNSEQFIKFTKDNGMQHNGVEAILEDDDGNIWFSSQTGLTKFKYKPGSKIKFRNFDMNDDLGNFDFNDNSAFKNKNGLLFFGGMNGFNFFNPSLINENKSPPSIAFTSFKKFDKEVFSIDVLSNLKKINLSYSDNFFSFEFTALDFTKPTKNKFAYKLEGFDKEWIYSGNRRYASYTNLDPGKYIFKVKGTNNDGVWSKNPAYITIYIKPPFYRTWWAYAVYVFLFFFGLIAVRNYELNKRRKKEEETLKRQREEAELKQMQLRAEASEYKAKMLESEKEIEKQQMRNRIASDLHDEIGSNLSSIILMSSSINKKLNHDEKLQQYINDIYLAAKLSSEAIRDIIWFINPNSDKIGNLISRMKNTANSMLSNLKYEFKLEEINTLNNLNPEVKRNIYLIFKEVLNNIIKHSEAERVVIHLKNENNFLVITITDNGKGFNKNEIAKGNGLRNMKNRAEQIGADLIISSNLFEGTKILLKAANNVNT